MDTVTPVPDNELQPRQAAEIRPYPNENMLYRLMMVFSVPLIILLTVGTVGIIWLFILWGFLGLMCLTSYFISHVRGNGVRITPEQYPQLHQRLLDCCARTGVQKLPEFYLLAGDGMRNAFAARFLNRYYVVLLADIVDALDDDEEALNFYIGHELGHIARRHLTRAWFVQPVMWLPLVGSAYSRAREYTCDQYGLACCASQDSAVHALSVLAAGSKRWKTLNKTAYVQQTLDTGGFWMSLNELLSDYPWLSKRVARIRGEERNNPNRHVGALLLACLVPRTGLGIIGAFIMFSYIALVAGVMTVAVSAAGMGNIFGSLGKLPGADIDTGTSGILAVHEAHAAASGIIEKIDTYVAANQKWPATLADAGVEPSEIDGVEAIELMPDAGHVLNVRFKSPNEGYSLAYVRSGELDAEEAEWNCGASGMPDYAVPSDCQSAEGEATEEAEAD